MSHHVPPPSSDEHTAPPGPISVATFDLPGGEEPRSPGQPTPPPLPVAPAGGGGLRATTGSPGAPVAAAPPAGEVALPAAGAPPRPDAPAAAAAGRAAPAAGLDRVAIAASLPRVPYAVQSLGPVGRQRSPWLGAGLLIVTLGLSGVRWMARVNREAVEFDPRMHANPRRAAAALVGPLAACLALALGASARIVAARLGHPVDVRIGEELTAWLVLAPALAPPLCALWSLSLGATLMTLERVRVVEDRAGVPPDEQLSPARCAAWLLAPVVGLAVVMACAQRRLNRVWATSV